MSCPRPPAAAPSASSPCSSESSTPPPAHRLLCARCSARHLFRKLQQVSRSLLLPRRSLRQPPRRRHPYRNSLRHARRNGCRPFQEAKWPDCSCRTPLRRGAAVLQCPSAPKMPSPGPASLRTGNPSPTPPPRYFRASTRTRRASLLARISGTYIASTRTGSARKSPGVTARIPKRISHVPASNRSRKNTLFSSRSSR